jgi:formylmethanofuran dehydrogenase subunit B
MEAMENVNCGLCGLLCDDLRVANADVSLAVVENGCARSRALVPQLTAPRAGPAASIAGVPCTLEAAVHRAAQLLAVAKHPHCGGSATDVAGMRALLPLAEQIGASIDHLNSNGLFRNMRIMQEHGWITTTLAEVKNRADLIVLVGTDVTTRFPRFFERFVWTDDTLFGLRCSERSVVALGEAADLTAARSPTGVPATHLHCANGDLREVLGTLRALMNQALEAKPERSAALAPHRAPVPMPALHSLLAQIRAATYPVFVWCPPDLAFPHAELTVLALTQLVRQLNVTQRAAALPLGGSDGDATVNAVHLWQTGYPLRAQMNAGERSYDPFHFSTERVIADRALDCLLWIDAFSPTSRVPAVTVPRIVLGTSLARAGDAAAEVYIDVGTPGVHHRSELIRTDQVVLLSLDAMRADATRPSVASVVQAIHKALPC